MKIVIIGGVAGGASAAARARRLSEDAEIILIERGPDVSFANCGLPYHLSGKIADRNKLLVTTPERLRTRFHIDVRVRSQVESIDREAKTVSIRDLNSDREYAESYDRLILSPGASPFRPPVPGVDLPQIHTLRNLQDMDRIKQAMTGEQKTAVIIGAGFIGLELAENFHQAGLVTSIVELQSQVLPPLDPEMTTPIAYELAAKGISLYLNDSAEAFAALDRGVSVKLKSGVELNADVCVL
ncbi:MAG: FAD-dependent oxidoreductase, partial [bacterium]|nr:FAD-dependent oxidoreductase [bacterium]